MTQVKEARLVALEANNNRTPAEETEVVALRKEKALEK